MIKIAGNRLQGSDVMAPGSQQDSQRTAAGVADQLERSHSRGGFKGIQCLRKASDHFGAKRWLLQ